MACAHSRRLTYLGQLLIVRILDELGGDILTDPGLRRKWGLHIYGNAARGGRPGTTTSRSPVIDKRVGSIGICVKGDGDKLVLELRQRTCPSSIGKIYRLSVALVCPSRNVRMLVSQDNGRTCV